MIAASEIRINPTKIARTLGLITVILLVLSVVINAYEVITGTEIINKFDVNWEASLPAYFSSLMLLMASALLYILSYFKRLERNRFFLQWFGLATIFFLLSIDETVGIHEGISGMVGHLINTGGIFRFAWVIPGSFFVVLFAISYWKFLMHLPRHVQFLFAIAGFVFVGGALGMELVEGYYYDLFGMDTLIYVLITTTEEAMEMTGIVIFIYILLKYARSYLSETKLSFATHR